jgi:hypothetical protein
VNRPHPGAPAGQPAADVHQARRVDRADHLGVRVEDISDLVGEHRRRDIGVLHRERPAETAALERIGQLHQVDPAHGAEQALRPVAHPQRTERVAGRVVGNAVGVVRAHVLDPENVDQELRQLVHRQRICAKLLAEHPRARRRRRHDRLVAVEHPRQPPRERQPFLRISAVQVHLAAAGLLLGELDLHAEPLEQPHDRLSG